VTAPLSRPAPTRGASAAGDLVELAGGTFLMGSDEFYPEERPVREVTVGPFAMARHPVTNREFAAFVAATGWVTLAERQPCAADYPDADPALVVPGSSVFVPPPGPVDLGDLRHWWAYVPGADWRHPEGPGSAVDDRWEHPVVHVAHADAAAYAAWAGAELPTEAEWEYAARGGLVGAAYAWGDELHPDGRRLANTWEGRFPWERRNCDWDRTSPVGAFPANGYGLFDMIGNVWEWTDSAVGSAPPRSCCSQPPEGPAADVRIVKGGSFLCAPGYCRRYRPAARQAQPVDSSTSHIGFRCIVR
jgi:sulfatase modifying factor 1